MFIAVQEALALADNLAADLRSLDDKALLGELLRRRRLNLLAAQKRTKIDEQKLLDHITELLCGSAQEPYSLWKD